MEDNEGQILQYLTFDDVLIAPNYSDIESRKSIDTSVQITNNLSLQIPIISSNMDFITGPLMAKTMYASGGLGILHRFWSSEDDYIIAINDLLVNQIPAWISIGVRNPKQTLEFVKRVSQLGKIEGFCIDVAHGHHKKVAEMLEFLKGSPDRNIASSTVIAGNVATVEGATFLAESGADIVKVGIGAGSVCTTRTVAGVGIPQLSAILETVLVKEAYPNILVIADGGIRSSGDIAKAIAVGADLVMIGNLLAGTDEAPGEPIDTEEGAFKRYRGQASFGSNGERYVKEGIEGLVPRRGPVGEIIQKLKAGLQSSMSYVGARTLSEFHEKAKILQVSSHTLMENNTRVREL